MSRYIRGRRRASSTINVNTLSTLGGFDLGESIADMLKSGATEVSKQVGKTYSADLNRFGKKIARSTVAQLIEPLPEQARLYIQPGYVDPKPLPTWVNNIVNPVLDPVTAGAKQEAYETSKRLVPFAAGALFLILLTGFGLGYSLRSLMEKSGE